MQHWRMQLPIFQNSTGLYAGTQPLDAGGRPWQGTNPVKDEEAADLTTGSGAKDGASVKGEQMLATPWFEKPAKTKRPADLLGS